MKIHLDNYSLNSGEVLFSLLTLTGGALVERHWSQSNDEGISTSSKWGQRIIAVIEAVPLLGGLVALIEMIVASIFCQTPTSSDDVDKTIDSDPPISSAPLRPCFEFNVPVVISSSQYVALKIDGRTSESELPEYTDSFFQVISVDDKYVITRRKKGETPTLNGMSVKILPFAGPKDAQSNEGLKVRTFCLELLSNIEDVQMAKESSKAAIEVLIRIEEIKRVVRHFLEQGALEKKAGFSDLTRLLNVLEKGNKEFSSIFNRISYLVELQKKIPQKKKGKINHWDKIRTLVHSRLFVREESAKKIGLHPFPAIPQRHTIVNLYPTMDAINLLEKQHREAGRWLMHRTRVITFRELCRSIQLSCEHLRDSMSRWNDYYLLSFKDKSQEWMADIAYRYLPAEKLPQGILTMEHQSSGKDLFEHITRTNSNHFMLFDDSAYSGQQLEGYVQSLHFHLKESGPLKEKKNIYFIFGFFPNDKCKKVVEDVKKLEAFNVHIHIHSKQLTKRCSQIMDEEGLTPAMKKKIEDLAQVDRPQLATEWKRPDFMSTSMFITEGYLSGFSRARCGELKIENEVHKVELLHGLGPITEVIPPYKKARV